MERIGHLLFVAIAFSIFAYLIVYFMTDFAGNGGEYWGFDGRTESYRLAVASFDEGDYRFLEIDLVDPLRGRENYVPGIAYCDNHPLTTNYSRSNSITSRHGSDSVGIVGDFAYEYNIRMAGLLDQELQVKCHTLLRR